MGAVDEVARGRGHGKDSKEGRGTSQVRVGGPRTIVGAVCATWVATASQRLVDELGVLPR